MTVSLVLAACGQTVMQTRGDATPDGGGGADAAPVMEASAPDAAPDVAPDAAPDVLPDGPFMTAAHTPLPQIPTRGGPILAHPRLVIVTFADDPARQQYEDFGAWVGTSEWLRTTGADYGVGAGTLLGNARLTMNAPDAMTNTQLEAMLATGIQNGTIVSPMDRDFSNVLYMVFFPTHTTLTLQIGRQPASQSCREFGGYHSEVRATGLHVAYAALPNCGGGSRGLSEFDTVTVAATHEYIEAATDPFPLSQPAYNLPTDGSSAWPFLGGETGDLCAQGANAVEGMYAVTRVWSNRAAMRDLDPCIPALSAAPYFNVSPDEGDVEFVTPNSTFDVHLTGFSSAPVADFTVTIMQVGGSVRLTPTLDTTRFNNGVHGTLSVRIPATAPSGSYAAFVLLSTSTSASRERRAWPVVYVIN